MTAIFPKLLSIVVVESCLLAACVGSDGPQPPPILSMYGDFVYAEHDTTWLQQLPLTILDSKTIFTEDDIHDMGLQGAQAFYPLSDGKWIIHANNTGAYGVEEFEDNWTAKRIGADGQGPGEYPNNRLMATMIADSTLWLNISGIRHIQYHVSGQFLTEQTLRSGSSSLGSSPTYTQANGYLFTHASQADSMIVKYFSLSQIESNQTQFNQCIPRPLKQTSGGIGVYESSGYDVNEHGEGLAYLSRYPYLIRFDVDDNGECHTRQIINIDPSNSDGTPVISSPAPGSGQPAWRSFPVIQAVYPIDRCWIILTSAMAAREYLRLCSDGTMDRVQFRSPDGQIRGLLISSAYNGRLYGRFYYDDKSHYVEI